MNYKDDSEIVSTFLIECKEHLDVMEHGILMLENSRTNGNRDLVDNMFRAAHSIKAGANLLEYKNIEAIAHSLEEILQQVRLGNVHLSSDDVSHFLLGIDKLSEMIDRIHYSDLITIEPLIRLLNAIILK